MVGGYCPIVGNVLGVPIQKGNFRRGYPIDRRPIDQVAKRLRGPVGDFESAAARVVARLTGERVILQDDGSRDSMVDIRIEYTDRDPGYVEVLTDIGEGYAATWARLMRRGQLPLELHLAGLRRDWFVTVSGRSDLRRLEIELEGSLASLEVVGLTFERVATLQLLKSIGDVTVGRLLDLGVVMLSSKRSSAEQGSVRVYPDGIVGPGVALWEPVLEWIERLLASQRLTDVRTKLAKTDAEERHIFLGVTFTSPGEVFFRLTVGEQTVPSAPPTLPGEITHVWLMNAPSPERCLAWFPDRGWFDTARHWATD
jgi:hypothetical protein